MFFDFLQKAPLSSRLQNRSRIILLMLVMTLVMLLLGGTIIMTLFFTSSEANKRIMTTFAENQAHQILSIVQLSKEKTDGVLPSQAVLDHIHFTLEKTPPITETSELMFAYKKGNSIHFINDFRFMASHTSKIYSMDDPRVKAMRLALDGGDLDSGLNSGRLITKDYRGQNVLAAYSSVEGLNLGIVTKIDLDEVRTPFIKTGITAGIASFILIGIASFLFHRIGDPLVQRLEENEMKYRTLFENGNEGVLVIGDTIEECNDRVTELLGFSREEIIGSSINDYSPVPDVGLTASTSLIKQRFDMARQGVPQYFVWPSRHKDGSLIELDVMLRAVSVGDRRLVLATVLDITDRRRAEIELRQAEEKVSESREHLAHVARLNTMGEMAAGIAHEINQPLAAISTYAQACKRMQQSNKVSMEDFAEPMDKIATQAMRAGEVIRRLRSFVKKSDSGFEVVQCNQLVRDVVKLAEVDARKYDIPVEMYLQERLPSLRIDVVQIQQVILNLIRNALEAMEETPRGTAKVSVYTEVTAQGQIAIRVADKGSGLSAESLERVFHPFFTTKASGMGMGLSISESIVQAHGGSLNAYNNPLLGATFVVVLPSAVEAALPNSPV